MGLFKKNKPDRLEIEVSEKHTRFRFVLVVLLLAIGLSLIVFGFYSLITKEPGWYTIELTEGPTHLNEEFFLNYCVGDDKLSASDEYKSVQSLYTVEVSRIYRLLDVYRDYEDAVNLYTINAHPGETFEVDPILYDAFELIEKTGSRILYMAPVFSEYRHLFGSLNDIEAALCDPYGSEETRIYLDQVMKYAADPSMIRVELLGENRISLYVADTYMSFLKENGITDLIDFGWLTNAFIVDHVAQTMISHGYTAGTITSYDGYTRNFDSSSKEYAFNIFDRSGDNVYSSATAKYCGNISMVFLRDYPMSTRDATDFYAYEDGRYAHRYADTVSGVYKSALHNLVSYSYDTGCSEVAIKMADVFISDEFSLDRIENMKSNRIYSIWCLNGTVYYNDDNVIITNLYTDEETSYQSAYYSIAK